MSLSISQQEGTWSKCRPQVQGPRSMPKAHSPHVPMTPRFGFFIVIDELGIPEITGLSPSGHLANVVVQCLITENTNTNSLFLYDIEVYMFQIHLLLLSDYVFWQLL